MLTLISTTSWEIDAIVAFLRGDEMIEREVKQLAQITSRTL